MGLARLGYISKRHADDVVARAPLQTILTLFAQVEWTCYLQNLQVHIGPNIGAGGETISLLLTESSNWTFAGSRWDDDGKIVEKNLFNDVVGMMTTWYNANCIIQKANLQLSFKSTVTHLKIQSF
jgi:hypothetical protein